MGLEPGTWTRTESSALQLSKKNGDAKPKSPGAIITFHPRKKRLPENVNPKPGASNEHPGREMPTEIMETPPFPAIPSFPGNRVSRTREGTFRRSQLVEFAVAPFRSPVTPRAAVWRSSGAVARPWGVRWLSGEPASRGAYYNCAVV